MVAKKAFSNIKKSVRVKDVMTKNIISHEKDETVYEAAKTMSEKNISTIVTNPDKGMIGIVTERDLLKRVLMKGKDPKKIKISQIMTKTPKTIRQEASILLASNVMKKENVRKLIVVDENDKTVGIISQTDIIKSMNEIHEQYKSMMCNPTYLILTLGFIIVLFLVNLYFFR